jgi:DNA-binding HxlR family transcriptional regulator
MNMNEVNHSNCGIAKTLETIGGKWTMLILRDLLEGPKRFSELERSLAGISTRTLTQRLENLANEGLLVRDCSADKAHPRYCLTAKGESLHGIIDQMRVWGETSQVA